MSPSKNPDIPETNPDKENLHLKTEIVRVENPGTPNEERARITDPDKMQLLATPGKAIVAPVVVAQCGLSA
ncbi:hypothetical protein [Sansalvadorimonas verongulae]|uniref:hypothetical protein n=1 Tax=Sansalvadorimonas verongulae TaxID=2172824 RepID=UPI0012BC741C|nr:hypothetical protein [Sansalvadorimonas verongulae]MTI13592.1 hypothetical protein [Sansalvadorimonas verongulae]